MRRYSSISVFSTPSTPSLHCRSYETSFSKTDSKTKCKRSQKTAIMCLHVHSKQVSVMCTAFFFFYSWTSNCKNVSGVFLKGSSRRSRDTDSFLPFFISFCILFKRCTMKVVRKLSLLSCNAAITAKVCTRLRTNFHFVLRFSENFLALLRC